LDGLGDTKIQRNTKKSQRGGEGKFISYLFLEPFFQTLYPHVTVLKNFRDKYLLTNFAGKAFLNLYYKYSPTAADFIRRHDTARAATRFVLAPIIFTIKYPFVIMLFLMFAACIVIRRRKLLSS